jgi:hypothetical protein
MNRKAYASVLALIFLALVLLPGCSSSHSTPPVESIAATSGSGQSATVNTAFAAPLVATVTTGGSPTSGATVTFTAPASGASGTFANGTTTDTETTNASGVATSTTFTANGTAGGPYTVTATVPGVATPANFSLTNTNVVTSTQYSFYVSGLEAVNDIVGPNFYALAGSVAIDPNGNVLAGEQNYNDGFGFTSPTSGDLIGGGTLTVDGTTGQGTLTLITNNPALGVNGTETLGVQFVNTKHALVVQFDGTATSSGSMDLQTLSGALSGPYAFTVSGVDSSYFPLVAGGVFSISGTSMSGLVDVDDAGFVTLGTPFSGTISAPDSLGRGTITGTGLAITLAYYIVGPEAIRIIDVDPSVSGVSSDSFVGSAFGQGAGAFDNASLGSSVFGVESNSFAPLYAAAGMFTTIPASGTFSGVGDNDEAGLGGPVVSDSPISGTYSILSNGYGGLTITNGGFADVIDLGIYMTDPNLNLNDPNNTASGLGGALVADLDVTLNGTGVLTPQTDTAAASFSGNYAFGAQVYNGLSSSGWEFDFVGQGSVTGGVLTGTGLVSDPFFTFSGNPTDPRSTFSGTATPDGAHPGRYTMFAPPLAITAGGSTIDFQVVVYQASGGQLFWLDEDVLSLSLGPLEQQGSLTGLPAARGAPGKTKAKRKP